MSTGRQCDGYAAGEQSSQNPKSFPIAHYSGPDSSFHRVQSSPFVITTSTGYNYGASLSLRSALQGTPPQHGYKVTIDTSYSQMAEPPGLHKADYIYHVATPVDVPRSFSVSTADRLVSILEIKDPRYSIDCYGGFLRYVPKHLGRNEALDAAVEALVWAHPYHYTREIPEGAVVRYIATLKELRTSMTRPDKVSTIETWAAVYIAMICQVRCGCLTDFATCIPLTGVEGLDRSVR